jgi:chemotaxis protein MotB
MCFFVLLLAFAEMDALKYKMVVKSLDKAFGVQRKVAANEIPKGTSIIAQEFSPGEPRPTPLNRIQQESMDQDKQNLKVTMDAKQAAEEEARQLAAEAYKFKEALEGEIAQGLIDVETQFQRIIIRIREKGSFPSDDARLNRDFIPILDKIHDVLVKTEGKIAVAGHTDNVPINTPRYRSNWELSTSRATSVVHEFLKTGQIPANRFVLEGYAETQPLLPNDTSENRARNRRVEIIVLKAAFEEELTRSISDLNRVSDGIEGQIEDIE